MRPETPPGDTLARRLPLPLAQLYRRAHNAKTPFERHLAAYYLWEAGLKLLASVAVVAYAERGPAAPEIADKLKNLARPAVGHWWEFVRLLVPALADAGDPAFVQLRDRLFGKPCTDAPRAAGLNALLREVLENKPGARATVQFAELFQHLIALRNDEVGHGAAGQRPPGFYERSAPALLAGITESFDRLDVLAGRRLVHVADVRRLASGNWLVERLGLSGGEAVRLESLEVPETDAARLPRPGRLYLVRDQATSIREGEAPAEPPAQARQEPRPLDSTSLWCALHPLVIFDADAEQVFFLNSRVRQRKAEYLCYTSGEVVRRDELGQDQRDLLAKVLGGPVDGAAVEAWAERSRSGEPAALAGVAESSRRTVGEFELIGRLGRGGMGVVYRAWQPSLGRQVALKCLLRLSDPKAEARFAREIRALGKVEHPNLVKAFTSGADGDQWFYAMELVEGADLAAVCAHLAGGSAAMVSEDAWQAAVSTVTDRQRRQEERLDTPVDQASGLPEKAGGQDACRTAPSPMHLTGRTYIARVTDVARQVAEAAHALHEAGVIHRDIKPGNIMLSADGGHAVLLDLGLAQLSDEEEGRLTKTRQFVGTLRYASLEQMLAAKLDRRADVYSLGATLWELLTLRPLFGATDQTPTPELMLKIQTAEPERVRKHNPRVPADLEAIVTKCLEKDRSRRYATAADLAADLGRWQRGEAVQAQPPSLGYLLRKQMRRYRVPLTVAAGVLLAAVVGTVLAFVSINAALDREKTARGLANTKEKQTNEALTREQDSLRREKETGERRKALLSEAARSYCDWGDREFRVENARDGLNWMLRAYETAPEDDRLRPSYARLLETPGQSFGRAFAHRDSVRRVAFSPDGRLALTGSLDGSAGLWDVATGKQTALLRHEDKVVAVAFSPDGRLALTGSFDKTARLWDVATGKQAALFQHEDKVVAVAFSPDGRLVLTGSGDTARLWDVATGKQTALLHHLRAVHTVAFSPDGRLALTGAFAVPTQLWHVATGNEVIWLQPENGEDIVAFSPDGRLVLIGSFDNRAQLGAVATDKQAAFLQTKDAVSAVAFSPDGRLALTGSADGTARLWDIATGKETGWLQHRRPVEAVAFSPDGRLFLTASADGTAVLWDVATRKQTAVLQHQDTVSAVAFSPDGRLALTGSADGTARLWDVAAGKETTLLKHQDAVSAVAFSPDGRLALTGGSDESARLWDVATGKETAFFQHKDTVRAVAFSPDGRLALTGGYTARLWDVATGEQTSSFEHNRLVTAVAFSPNGQLVLTGSFDGSARLWDVAAGKETALLKHQDTVSAVAFSADSRLALTGSADGTARLWDAATGKQTALLRHEGAVYAVALSPDGQLALTGSVRATALWDVATGKRTPLLESEDTYAVAFSPDGRLALTGSRDGTARLWDVATGKQTALFRHLEGAMSAVAFSPDGRRVLTGSNDWTARLWDVPEPFPDANPDRLRAWVHVQTYKKFDEQGVLRELTSDEFVAEWRQLHSHGGDWFRPLDARRWHRIQATEAEAERQWFAAVFHLSRLVKEEPNDADLRARLARAQVALKEAK